MKYNPNKVSQEMSIRPVAKLKVSLKPAQSNKVQTEKYPQRTKEMKV